MKIGYEQLLIYEVNTLLNQKCKKASRNSKKIVYLFHQTSDKKLLSRNEKGRRYLTGPYPDLPDLWIRILKKAEVRNHPSTGKFSNKKGAVKGSFHVDSKKQVTKEISVSFWFNLKTKKTKGLQSFFALQRFAKTDEKVSFNGTSFRKTISSEISNEQLERNALTGATGELKAEKNG